MGQDAFISYKSEEFQEADWVRQQLESGGISCWMAPNSITGGASYATEIPQAIRSCRCRAMSCCQRLCGERSALADTYINKKGC